MEVDEPVLPPLNPLADQPPAAAPPAALPAAINGGELTQNQPKPTEQPQPLLQPQAPQPQVQPAVLPKPKAVIMVPALWENRLRGVMAYDFETGDEIKINPEKLHQNGWSHPGNETIKEGQALTLDNATLTALLNKQLIQQVTKIEDKKLVPGSTSAGNIVPSLLAHGRNARQLTPMVPSLKTIKENGSLIAAPQQNSLGGGNIVLTLPSMASANAYPKPSGVGGIGTLAQPRNVRTTIVPGSGRAVSTNKPGASSVSQGLYVSESEVRRQEEKVQMIRKQLMAAQSTV